MKIPIRNLYYILCYAFDHLEEGQRIDVGQDQFDNTTNLFAKLMTSACETLNRQGFWLAYREDEQELQGLRGKVLFGESLKQNHFMHGRAICLADDFTLNVLPNQILKATLLSLLRADELDRKYEDGLHHFLRMFEDVSDIKLYRHMFSRVTFHRNNRLYRFLMSLCELIFDCWLPDQKIKGKYIMRELLQDEVRMRKIFQSFVRSFYLQEQTKFSRVTSEYLQWDAVALTEGGLDYLPRMETDISLLGNERTFIIDTKYYAQALTNGRYGKETIQSGHLYQLTNYLDHKAKSLAHKPEGMLLYPANGKSLRLSYEIKGHRLSICTIDLSQKWELVHQELLELVA